MCGTLPGKAMRTYSMLRMQRLREPSMAITHNVAAEKQLAHSTDATAHPLCISGRCRSWRHCSHTRLCSACTTMSRRDAGS